MKKYLLKSICFVMILSCNIERSNIAEIYQMENRDCNVLVKSFYNDSLLVRSETYSNFSGESDNEFDLDFEKVFEYNCDGLLIKEGIYDFINGSKVGRYYTLYAYDDFDRLIETTQFNTQQDTIKRETWDFYDSNKDSTMYRVRMSTIYVQRHDHEKMRQMQKDMIREKIVFLENDEIIKEIEGDVSSGVFDTLRWNYYSYRDNFFEKSISFNNHGDTIFLHNAVYEEGQLKKEIIELPTSKTKSVTLFDENGCSYRLINYDKSEMTVRVDTAYFLCDNHGRVIVSCWKRNN